MERVIGEKEKKFMSNKMVNYSDGEIGKVKIIEDFLPNPKDLVLKDDSTKITIALSKNSVAFFKKQAKIYHVPYQKMIKAVLDKYATYYK